MAAEEGSFFAAINPTYMRTRYYRTKLYPRLAFLLKVIPLLSRRMHGTENECRITSTTALIVGLPGTGMKIKLRRL
jgi:hypothetical protein